MEEWGVAFRIFGWPVHWYGIILTVGVFVGAYLAEIQARRRGLNPDHVWSALLLCVILGVLGARLYHVFSSPQGGVGGWAYYREHPEEILAIWKGGLGIYGAFIGGALGLLIYVLWKRLNPLEWLDIGVYGLLAGQAIGRWGNFVNQELYGPPTTLPWGIHIDMDHRLPQYANLPLDTRFHPVFLYESLWNAIGLALLWWIGKRYREWLLDGDIFCMYLIWYPLGRFWVEFLRPDAWMLGKLAAAQVFSLIFMGIGVVTIVVRHMLKRDRGEAEVSVVEE